MSFTKQDILDYFNKQLSIKNNKVDLSTGTVVRDLGVESMAEVLSQISGDIDTVRGMVSLNPEYFTDEQADQFAQSYDIKRHGPQKATGTVSFGALEPPAVGSPIIIPIGTYVVGKISESSSPITFVTTTEGSIISTSPYNSNTGYYETTVGIEAVIPGTGSNVGIGYVNQLQTTISGISAVYNKDALVNGTDTETTENLLARVNLKKNGRNLNSQSGLLSWVYDNPNVKQAIIVSPNSEYSLRGPGAVDIYVLGEQTVQYTQTVTNISKEAYLVATPVVNNAASIYVTVNGISYHESDNVFVFVKDSSTIYMNSSKAKDKIVWTDIGFELIKNVSSYTITYTYNGLISDLQVALDDNDYRSVTGDILIRATNRVDLVMEFGISVLNGYDKNAVISDIKTAIESFINRLALGENVRQSDIINVVEGTAGVDYVILPFLQFKRVNETDPTKEVADIIASPLEYFRITSENIIIG